MPLLHQTGTVAAPSGTPWSLKVSEPDGRRAQNQVRHIVSSSACRQERKGNTQGETFITSSFSALLHQISHRCILKSSTFGELSSTSFFPGYHHSSGQQSDNMSSKTEPSISAPPKEEQVWFFLLESMESRQYKMQVLKLSQVSSTILTLQDCLKIVGVKGKPEEYSFYLYSESMSAAVQLLSDQSIPATWNLYCQKDLMAMLTIRLAKDPSPNSSRALSHPSSLAEIRKISSGRPVPDIRIQPPHRHASGSTDAYTCEPIVDEDTMVSIRASDDKFLTFHKVYLICEFCRPLPRYSYD